MKERLDVLLVNRGLAPSREKAKTMHTTKMTSLQNMVRIS